MVICSQVNVPNIYILLISECFRLLCDAWWMCDNQCLQSILCDLWWQDWKLGDQNIGLLCLWMASSLLGFCGWFVNALCRWSYQNSLAGLSLGAWFRLSTSFELHRDIPCNVVLVSSPWYYINRHTTQSMNINVFYSWRVHSAATKKIFHSFLVPLPPSAANFWWEKRLWE